MSSEHGFGGRYVCSSILIPPTPYSTLPSCFHIAVPSLLPPSLGAQLTLSDGPDPHVEGAKGGKASGSSDGETYKPTEHGGLKKDGTEDKRTSSEHGFGGS